MRAVQVLESMGILIFHGDGTPKNMEEILKEIQEKISKETNGDENMINKQENREVQVEEVNLKDIIYDLVILKDAVIYEVGSATVCGLQSVVNSLKQTTLKIDTCICDLKNIDEDFEDKICEINKAIDALKAGINKVIEVEHVEDTLTLIKEEMEETIDKLKVFNETYNSGENLETTERDPSAEEDKKKMKKLKKQSFDEVVLNENIEVMRKEIKEIDSCVINIKPIERAEILTKLSKEIKECINMKNYIEISNEHRENEDDR